MNPGRDRVSANAPSGYLAPPRPHVVAHRGLVVNAPENSLGAFADALECGATHIETDVRTSSDGVAVLAHDPDLVRLAGCDSLVRDLTVDQLCDIDLGGGHRIATLAQALRAFPDSRFNIDIKDAESIDAVATAVADARATARVLITSFSEARRRRAVALLPQVATSASARRFAVALVLAKLGWVGAVRRTLRGLDAVQVPERAYTIHIATRRVIHALRSAGVTVHFWTINDPIEMRRLFDLGVDGIVTDRPDLANRLILGIS